eukprot:COSAG02_NODE_2574_length_8500_cov_21.668254_2_plen_105_part_00
MLRATPSAMLVASAMIVSGTAGLNITTQEKIVWMEFPELLTVVRHSTAWQKRCCAVLRRVLSFVASRLIHLGAGCATRLRRKGASTLMLAAARAAPLTQSTTSL